MGQPVSNESIRGAPAPLPHQQLAQLGGSHGDPVARAVEHQRAQLLPAEWGWGRQETLGCGRQFKQRMQLLLRHQHCSNSGVAFEELQRPASTALHTQLAAHLPMDSVWTVVRSGSCSSSKMPLLKPTASRPTAPC